MPALKHSQGASDRNSRLVRVLIADDHDIFRYTLSRLVENLPRLELVGAAVDGPEALKLAAVLRPDLVLMDLDMPGLSGLEAAARIRESAPAVRVLIVTCDDSEEARAACLAQGADGFVSKDRLWPELQRAVAEVFPPSLHPGREGGPAPG